MGDGIDDAAAGPAAHVFPGGNPAGLGRPGVECLPGGEPGSGSAGGQGGAFPPGGFFGEQGTQHLDGFPPLRFGGGDDVGCVAADVRQPEPTQQGLDVVG